MKKHNLIANTISRHLYESDKILVRYVYL